MSNYESISRRELSIFEEIAIEEQKEKLRKLALSQNETVAVPKSQPPIPEYKEKK